MTQARLVSTQRFKEILALLEGIDQYKEDWTRVATHVNTTCHNGEEVRTHEDCITTFIR